MFTPVMPPDITRREQIPGIPSTTAFLRLKMSELSPMEADKSNFDGVNRIHISCLHVSVYERVIVAICCVSQPRPCPGGGVRGS